MTQNLTKAQDVFLERINSICNKFGLNNIMAQLYAILYLSGKPMSLDDMVERLKISKGSASINIRALERYGVVKQIWVKGSRKDYYEAEADIIKVIMDRIKAMASSRLSEIDEMLVSSTAMLESISSDDTEDKEAIRLFKERIEKVQELYDQAKAMFDLFNLTLSNKAFGKDNDAVKAEPYEADTLAAK